MAGVSFTIYHVGKSKTTFVRAGLEHYIKKIQPYASLSFKKLAEEPLRKGLSVGEVKRKEAENIEKAMDNKGPVWIVLDQKGKQLPSEEFSALIENWMVQGRSKIAFIIGGPHGISTQILKKADMVLSVSAMTFSHETMLVILLEQLYRSLAILNHLPYPK